MFQWYDGRHCVEKFWDMLLQLCIMHVINLAKLQSDCELKKKPQAEFFVSKHWFEVLQNASKCNQMHVYRKWNEILKRNTCSFKYPCSRLYKMILRYNICAEDNLILNKFRNLVNKLFGLLLDKEDWMVLARKDCIAWIILDWLTLCDQ